MKAKKNTRTLDEFKDEHYGKTGTVKRNELDTGFENFKIDAMIHDAKLDKGLTQNEIPPSSDSSNSEQAKQ